MDHRSRTRSVRPGPMIPVRPWTTVRREVGSAAHGPALSLNPVTGPDGSVRLLPHRRVECVALGAGSVSATDGSPPAASASRSRSTGSSAWRLRTVSGAGQAGSSPQVRAPGRPNAAGDHRGLRWAARVVHRARSACVAARDLGGRRPQEQARDERGRASVVCGHRRPAWLCSARVDRAAVS